MPVDFFEYEADIKDDYEDGVALGDSAGLGGGGCDLCGD